jgi:lysophospholipase L1-like esterase
MPATIRLCLSALLAAVLLPGCAGAPPRAAAAPEVPRDVSSADWAQDMARFAAADAADPPPKRAVLFVGSSSIRKWETLAADFPGIATINRGFGGSQVRDSTWYADRIVVPYAPRLIVFYAGDNDIDAGRSPRQVRDDFHAFVARVRRDLPRARILFVSIKPSPLRAAQLPAQREANALVRADVAGMENVAYVDVAAPMLDAGGRPRAELFGPDGLHMNGAGYALWRGILAPYLR